jgi:hypothetical protein
MKKIFYSFTLITSIFSPHILAEESSSFSVGVTGWAVFDNFDHFAIHLDYEYEAIESLWGIQPRAIIILAEQDQQYFGIGAAKTYTINKNWDWGIATHMGYARNIDVLGYDLEFYSFIFAKYKISEVHRLRGELGHISNAGFGKTNPGSESIVLSYSYHF